MIHRLAAAMAAAFFVVGVVAAAPVLARDINAGPIWSDQDARNKCPSVCAGAGGAWNGSWHTTAPGRMSVCSCRFGGGSSGRREGRSFDAGPIWSDQQAKTVCPAVCTSHNRRWQGEWRTTVPGRMSECTCYR
ncbi:mannan-binding lectin [Microbaculum marinisediminis]|uniref:Mannan-binding lectin n=1 Tax=Microbaculum marinisediminis TaxID=2931392 RepID=A0AAW5QU48_9HYPH|nr:mannan-binding lectin [Microbaculum sp. A6E488]MCT8970467.1 mannan-binding lectin [Microbaculum sp. A6E488]